ncbi:hypothetical protein SCHPADRAFT_946448 [Schizopora paradoxa]|uniref:Uncharacterized protein n=1 Tax=Schizopora paradoxa TaxID=27342 RepID=A0A0H2R962_9AGAM|nr:hypothetical protein SCHPADRAFT_946448 [Schizopora paradoxa]
MDGTVALRREPSHLRTPDRNSTAFSTDGEIVLDTTSSHLEEFLRDDVTYSYRSSNSSNETESDRTGAGRILGNMYSKAGRVLISSLRRKWHKKTLRDSPVSPLPVLVLRNGVEQEDNLDAGTVYTLHSSWSSGYTNSNRVGAGRVIGNLYSRAGSSLQKGFGSLAYRMGMGSYAKMLEHGFRDKFRSDDVKEHEKVCEIMLACAKSDDVEIQFMTFKIIVIVSVSHPSKVRSAFKRVFGRRKQVSDVTTFSWKRPGVEYPVKWLLSYKLACRFLSSQQSQVFDATAQFDGIESRSLDFSHFEELLLSCGDTTESLLVFYLIRTYWNNELKVGYVWRKEFDHAALVQFAIGLVAWWEMYFSDPHLDLWFASELTRFHLSGEFLAVMTRAVQNMDSVGLSDRSGDNARLEIWRDVFKLHHFVRR